MFLEGATTNFKIVARLYAKGIHETFCKYKWDRKNTYRHY